MLYCIAQQWLQAYFFLFSVVAQWDDPAASWRLFQINVTAKLIRLCITAAYRAPSEWEEMELGFWTKEPSETKMSSATAALPFSQTAVQHRAPATRA